MRLHRSNQVVYHLDNLHLIVNRHSSETNWSIGDIALHQKWGEGTVLEVSGSGSTQELKNQLPRSRFEKTFSQCSTD